MKEWNRGSCRILP